MPLAKLDHGRGARVWDDTGHEYLDFLAGIAVNSLGHAHPVFVEAVSTQAARLAHVSNYFTTEPALELAERLTRLAGAGDHGRAWFGNSGAEANEAAFKLAQAQQLGRRAHARALARRRLPRAHHGLARAHRQAAHARGVRAAARRRRAHPRHDRGARGRPSTTPSRRSSSSRSRARPAWSSCPTASSRPHASSPTATARCSSSTRSRPAPAAPASGSPSSTRASRPTRSRSRRASAAASRSAASSRSAAPPRSTRRASTGRRSAATRSPPRSRTRCSARSSAPASSRTPRVRGRQIRDRVEGLGSPLVAGTRGRGLLIGIALTEPVATAVAAEALRAGLIVNAANDSTIRMAPPLIIGDAEIDEFADRFARALDAVAAAHHRH